VARTEYIPIQCKTALNRVRGMPFKWSLNPYIGCAHGCHYCYARRPYALQAERRAQAPPAEQGRLCSCFQQDCHYCYARAYYARAEHGNGDTDFETKILVKVNLPEVLQRELSRPSWSGEPVALGTSTDAYQPAEGRFRITRRAIELLRDHRNPLAMVTKSPLVLRDVDLLAGLARVARVRVFFTVTTLDVDLWPTLEPGTANPLKRLQVMRLLNEAGVPAGVLLAPILPGLTDSSDSIEAVASAAAEHRAAFFGATALRLMPVVKEHYLGFVQATFPALLPRYRRAYSGTNAPPGYQSALDARVDRIRARYGFVEDSMRGRHIAPARHPAEGTAALPAGAQLALPL
jgi:DNA repair photolyase